MGRRDVRSTRARGRPVAALIAVGVVCAAALIWLSSLLVGALNPGTAAGTPSASPAEAAPSSFPDATRTETSTPAPPVAEPIDLTLAFAGDMLPHDPVVASATSHGVIDFAPLLAPTAPWIGGADLAICHMEVPVAPDGVTSGYPVFGAPAELVAGIAGQGWDGCSTASNHTLDKGYAGVEATLATFDTDGLGHAGSARSEKEIETPQLYTFARGDQTLTIAHIAAAYGTNGIPVPAAEPWAIELIDADRIIAQAKAARAAGADLVIVSLHWGIEMQATPTDEQHSIAEALATSGEVDLVVGHHAHVPQPIELTPGGVDGTGLWTIYGLGNFISNQSTACCTAQTQSGVVAYASVHKDPDGPARVTGVEWTGVTVDKEGGHVVYAFADHRNGAGTLSASEMATRHQLVVDAVGDTAPERTTPPTPTGDGPTVVPRER